MLYQDTLSIRSEGIDHMGTIKRINLYLFLALLLPAGTATAQLTHYWSNAYGTKAQLLGGVVVGSVIDLSATFYNPGAVVKTPDTNLIISTESIELRRYEVESAINGSSDVSYTYFDLAPSIFALRVTRKTKPNQFVVSMLTRYKTTVRFDEYVINSRDVIGGTGDDDFTAYADSELRLYEGWGGFSWSYAAGRHVGVGITQYLAFRDQHGRINNTAQGISTDGSDGAALVYMDKYDFYHIRTLWKVGALFDYNPLTFGVTLTTPSIGIYGKGKVFYDRSVVGVDSATPPSQLASTYQDGVPVTYRSPLSIAAGLSYRFNMTTVHLCAEWFSAVDEYTVLHTEDFVSQTTGELISNSYSFALRSVLNYGIGFEHKFSDLFTVYGSFIKDSPAHEEGSDPRLYIEDWNLYHIAGGTAFSFFNLHITTGLSFGFGSSTSERSIDFESGGGLAGEAGDTSLKYRRLLLLIGLAFDL